MFKGNFFLTVAACAGLVIASTACGSKDDSMAGSTAAGTGGGTASCTAQMHAKYGDAAFKKVTNDLVMLAATDTKVSKFFSTLDSPEKVTKFEDSLDKFLVYVYGGPNNYSGPDMVTAHTGLNITSDDYDYFVGLIVQVLTQDGVTKEDINDCFAPPVVDPALKAAIINK